MQPLVTSPIYRAKLHHFIDTLPEAWLGKVNHFLESLSLQIARSKKRPQTLAQALGLLATSQPPPTDSDIKQWLEEYRLEKYHAPVA